MAEIELRSFQAELFPKWKSAGFRGIVQAVPGSGKTIAAFEAIRQYMAYYTVELPIIGNKILIVVPTVALLKQWKGLMPADIGAEVMTINKARKLVDYEVELLVVDEIHRTTSEVNRRLYSGVKFKAILGLTATPNKDCAGYAGEVIQTVGFQQALSEDMIADFEVIFHAVDMTADETVEYERMTNQIKNVMSHRSEPPDWFRVGMPDRARAIEYAKYLGLQRRAIVYAMKNRTDYVLGLVKDMPAKKILVFSQRIEQAEDIARKLNTKVFHSKSKNDASILWFKSVKTGVLVTVRALTEGFDVPDIDTVIIHSTATTEAYHIQALGRAIRKCSDKFKEVHVLLGKATTDEGIVKHARKAGYKYSVVGTLSGKAMGCRSLRSYYEGEPYSIDHRGGIFKNGRKGRVYYDAPKELSVMLQDYKRSGGKFTLGSDGTVRVRVEGKGVVVGKIDPKLVKERAEQGWLTQQKLTFEEVFGKDGS